MFCIPLLRKDYCIIICARWDKVEFSHPPNIMQGSVYLACLMIRVGLRHATLRTTFRYVCVFDQNHATELRYIIFCYVTELWIKKRS